MRFSSFRFRQILMLGATIAASSADASASETLRTYGDWQVSLGVGNCSVGVTLHTEIFRLEIMVENGQVLTVLAHEPNYPPVLFKDQKLQVAITTDTGVAAYDGIGIVGAERVGGVNWIVMDSNRLNLQSLKEADQAFLKVDGEGQGVFSLDGAGLAIDRWIQCATNGD